MARFTLGLLALVLLALPLSGCGKVGSPSPPGPSEKITYPRNYPPQD